MSHRGEEEPTPAGHLSRTKTTRTGAAGGGGSERVKRSGTVAGARAASAGTKEAMPGMAGSEKSAARKESTGSGGGGGAGLSRKPTLVQTSSSAKFKQGTLLGDLAPPPPPSKHHLLPTADDATTLQAVLPAHILALSAPLGDHPRDPLPGLSSAGRSSSQPAASSVPVSTSSTTAGGTTTSTTTIKLRTWEQMGSEERKLYLAEVQNKAKLEGRTLLQFDHSDPPPVHSLHAPHHGPPKEPLISSVPSAFSGPPHSAAAGGHTGLKRSITLGGRSSAQKSFASRKA
ncbi:hypothetical protein PtB15_9B389 [Puccinia triticina]|nr:hypothetical protein PtB15_9B389 [Puccinia triticina]